MSTESEESPGLIEFLAWLETHKQKLVVGGVGVLLVGSAVYVSQWKADQDEQAGGAALYEVQAKEGQGEDAEAPSVEEYLAVANEHPGTTAAERALLLAARSAFLAGDYSDARSKFSEFQNQYGDSAFLSTATFGIAASDDAAGNLAEAKSGYSAVQSRFPNTPVASQAALALAILHESEGELKEALALYEALDRPGVAPSYSSRAISRRTKIYDKNPELRPEPLPEAATAEMSALPAPLTTETVATETVVVGIPAEEASDAGAAEEAPAEQPATGDDAQ